MMYSKKSLVIFIVFCTLTYSFRAQKRWHKIEKSAYSKYQKPIYQNENFPNKYELLSLDTDFLKSDLKAKSKNDLKVVELPDAHGNLKKFSIQETSNFQSKLQEKFPEVRSFTAKGIDDPTLIAKLSYGVDGFHGVIFERGKSTTYIDPYSKDQQDYIVYQRKDLSKRDLDFQCMVNDNLNKSGFDLTLNKGVNDGKLRTYRLALACSAEYAQFHLNRQNVSNASSDAVKKAAVLSAMNTSMTRINGVFENDLAVRMVLVNDNDKIIFLDSQTDGITDTDINAAISESQAICDAQIGASNYDIGHLLFTSGGQLNGLAGLGVVCVSNNKARGVTGLGTPVGDVFDIDLIAHEMGHQFGATHTQNNDCNRTSTTAVEVGSGTTIMGYSGICSPNVLGVGDSTGNSDDYFHAVSIAQIHGILQSNTCASLSDTNNATPTANAGGDYSIPKSTPFKLTGVATDADGLNSLTYNWEQIDNETGTMPPTSTNAVGPIFRSLPSKTEPVRYFPNLASVINPTISNVWEVLPSVSRDINFALTVRDNHSGGGATARDDMKVTVTSAEAFVVTSQATKTTWNTGASETITWNVGTTNLSPISCSNVNIKLSIDGGVTFPILLKSNTANDGSEVISVPDNATSNARIMVEAADNIFFNVNSADIIINSTTPTFVLNNTSGDLAACNSSNQTAAYTLNFDFVNGFTETVSLSATGNPSGSQVSFSPTSINADGNVVMTISNLNGITAQSYTINVKGTSNSVTQDVDVNLQVTSSTFGNIILASPSDNATNQSLTTTLSWAADANATAYDVQIATDNSFANVVSTGVVATNNYISTTLEGNTLYYWRVKPKNTCGEGSFSKAFKFTTLVPQYCNSFFTDEIGGTEHITNVKFNTINNNSNNDTVDGYQDFTSITTTIKREDTHQISVTFNTGGYQDQCFVYIDWNGDYVFDPSTEKYDLGQHYDDIETVNFNITVPSDAKLGSIRMRVFIEYFGDGYAPGAGACDADHVSEWGETEDYTIIVEDATASIADNNFFGFNLFPNPNSGKFTLMFETVDVSKTILELFDVSGRRVGIKVYENTNSLFRKDIQFSNLSSGLYLLKIKNGNKQSLRKLLVE